MSFSFLSEATWNNDMQRSFRRAILVVSGLMTAGGAHAQINPFRSTVNERLDKSDLALLDQTAEKLYTADNVADGASEKWMNPKTGTSGTVTMQSKFAHTWHGTQLDCRKIKYDILRKRASAPRTYVVNWCKQPDGEWKIL
jgi:surface antigen